MQHIDDARLLVRFQDVVKGFQLKGFHRMFFPRGDKDDKRFMGKLADVLRQQNPVERRNIDIEKDGVDLVVLEKFQHVQAVVKAADDLHLAMGVNKPGELLLGQKLILHNDNFHLFSAHDNSDFRQRLRRRVIGDIKGDFGSRRQIADMQTLAVEKFHPMMHIEQADFVTRHLIGFHAGDHGGSIPLPVSRTLMRTRLPHSLMPIVTTPLPLQG